MEGLERVHQQILQESKAEAMELKNAASLRLEQFLQREQKKADEQYDKALTEVKDAQQRSRAQLKADLGMTERRTLLATKQEWIHRVLQEALRQLAARPQTEKVEDYLAWLEEPDFMAEKTAQPEALVRIELSARDAELVEVLRQKIGYPVQINATATTFTAGLVVSVGLVHFNYTYEEYLRRNKDSFIGSIGAELFN